MTHDAAFTFELAFTFKFAFAFAFTFASTDSHSNSHLVYSLIYTYSLAYTHSLLCVLLIHTNLCSLTLAVRLTSARRRPCVEGDKCYPGRSDDEDDLVIGDTIGKFWMNKEIGQAFKQFGVMNRQKITTFHTTDRLKKMLKTMCDGLKRDWECAGSPKGVNRLP